MDFPDDLRLLDGPIIEAAAVLGVLGLVFLLLYPAVRGRRYWWPLAAGAAVAAALLALGLNWALVHLWAMFPEALPRTVIGWGALAIFAVLLAAGAAPAAARARSAAEADTTATAGTAAGGGPGSTTAAGARTRYRRRGSAQRMLLLPAAVLVVLLSALQINIYFGQYPTFGDLLHSASPAPPLGDSLKKAEAGSADTGPADQGPALPVYLRWSPPADLPAHGVIRQAPIPGTTSGWTGRPAYIYLPPAYLTAERPMLPVMILVAGQPGSPADWVTSNTLQPVMDAFAARHAGLAPVVVVPDPIGSDFGNTMCMDSKLGQTDTYLSADVPAWIKANLDVDPTPARWSFGGWSFGGTCAMQMGTRHAELFPNILAFSPEAEPSIYADRQKTIQAAFGSDAGAFTSQLPLTLLAENRYEASRLFLSAGGADGQYDAHLNVLKTAAEGAGMTVQSLIVPGAGHSWSAVQAAFPVALDFFSSRLGFSA